MCIRDSLSREFLASNGAPKQQAVHVGQAGAYERTWEGDTLAQRMNCLLYTSRCV